MQCVFAYACRTSHLRLPETPAPSAPRFSISSHLHRHHVSATRRLPCAHRRTRDIVLFHRARDGWLYRDMARLVFQPQALRKTGCAPMRESDLIINPAPAFEQHEAMSQSICRMREVLRRLSTTTDV